MPYVSRNIEGSHSISNLLANRIAYAVSFRCKCFITFVLRMKKTILFVFLCILLLKVGVAAPAVSVERTGPHFSSVLITALQSGQHISLSQAAESEKPALSLVTDDNEDDDVDELIVRKFKLLPRDYSPLYYQSPLQYSINRSKAAPCFFGRVCYKYLRQRVLRV